MLYSSGLLRIGVRIDFAKNSARRQRRHVGIGLLEYRDVIGKMRYVKTLRGQTT